MRKGMTYSVIPTNAITTPPILCRKTGRSLIAHPSPTTVHVFKCPMTVLLTGPIPSMM